MYKCMPLFRRIRFDMEFKNNHANDHKNDVKHKFNRTKIYDFLAKNFLYLKQMVFKLHFSNIFNAKLGFTFSTISLYLYQIV